MCVVFRLRNVAERSPALEDDPEPSWSAGRATTRLDAAVVDDDAISSSAASLANPI